MNRRILLFCLLAVAFFAGAAHAAPPDPVKWSARLDPPDARAGEGARVVVTATIEPPYHIYSATPVDGPVATTITLAGGKALTAVGKLTQPPAKKHKDEGFGIDVETYAGSVAFGLPVKVAAGISGKQKTAVKVRYQACTDNNCLLPATPQVPLEFTVAPGAARPDHEKPDTRVPPQPGGAQNGTPTLAAGATGDQGVPPPAAPPGSFDEQIRTAQAGGLLSFLWLSITMGFLALLTPCVFPMVPITVSFFAKRKDESPREGVISALAYCVGIVGTFTALGLALAILFGATGIQRFATNPYVNFAIAILFVVLALNLFGVFEIVLPSKLVNRAQAGGRGRSLLAPVLMGLTFTLTSFTCTVPFVGTLLVATTQGNLVWPIVGMLGFSTAFASPFFLLALFPQWLDRLPKAGGWLVTVKAFMGFLELAAAVKFLSNVDLVFQWGLITQAVFLAVWATIGVIAGFYLLGWLRLPHDPATVAIGVPRRLVALATLGAGLYCFAAINGAPLGDLVAWLPPDPYPGSERVVIASSNRTGVSWLRDYDQAVQQARRENKALFVNFTGVTCTNCRWMEKNMFTRPEIATALNRFVPVELYTDLPNERSTRYKELEEQKFGTVALPLYAVITPDGKTLASYPGLTRKATEFLQFLEQGHSAAQQVASGGAFTAEP